MLEFKSLDFQVSQTFQSKYQYETFVNRTLEEKLIRWVITVPAIWSDASKQFIREAALKVLEEVPLVIL